MERLFLEMFSMLKKQIAKQTMALIIPVIVVSAIVGGISGFLAGYIVNPSAAAPKWITQTRSAFHLANYATNSADQKTTYVMQEESAIIDAVEASTPAVVSIVVTKDVPKLERVYENPFGEDSIFNFRVPKIIENGTETKKIGGGTGFIVTSDGYIVTNRHVVYDVDASYTVIMQDGTEHAATILARDPVNDLAIIKIDGQNYKTLSFADSDKIRIGQRAITIGNSLGEFSNTVSTGVVSGLSRSIDAGGQGIPTERLTNVIQTDAAINPGNSGGPLLNSAGQVIGVNTAVAENGENIGFAIPSNEVVPLLESVKQNGKLVRPWLGVRYILNDAEIAAANNLAIDYGAIVQRGSDRTDLAVIPGSPADKAGIQENDIILEINGERIDTDHPLAKALSSFKPGEEIRLKIFHAGEEKEVTIILDEME